MVSVVPGTTRDRREAVGRLGDVRFLLIDKAGVDGLRLESWYRGRQRMGRKRGHDDEGARHAATYRPDEEDNEENDYQRPMMEQAVIAAQQASVIFFLFDGRVGLTADDLETCRWLRRHVLTPQSNKRGDGVPILPQRVVLVANKLEGTVLEDNTLYEEFLDEASRTFRCIILR